MDIQQAINWTDERVFEKTGKHLDSLQRTILEGTLENQTYNQVAENYHCSKDHTKRVASDLWKLLSDVLGEEVKKLNLKSILEQIEFSHISNFGSDSTQIFGNINFCSELCNHPTPKPNRSHPNTDNPSQLRHDLSEAPEVSRLYSRTDELATLKQWILAEHHRIIAITGLSGIGKTAIARQLVEEIKPNFDRILWRSHRKYPNLNSLKTDLIQFFSPTLPSQNSILDYLRSDRCLIILDDFQETLTPRHLVGKYRPEYETYGQFLNEIGRSPHHSCLLLLSWEQPTEIAILETENSHCKTLHLKGLDGSSTTELLTNRKLKDRERWIELIQRYSGNPLWLNIISATISDLFNGSVSKFLSYSSLFLGDIEPLLNEHYLRLSETEKLVMIGLANQNGITEISQNLENLSDSDYLKTVQSLKKRRLLEIEIENSTSILRLNPAIKEYFKNQNPH